MRKNVSSLLALGWSLSTIAWANDYSKLDSFFGFHVIADDRDRFIIMAAHNDGLGPDGVFRHRVLSTQIGETVPLKTTPLLLQDPLPRNTDLGFQEILVTDMNGDGRPDLVVSRDLGRMVWYEGEFDDGLYQLDSYTHVLGRGEVSSVQQLAAGDFDGDGDQDLLYQLLGDLEWLEQPSVASDDGPSWERHLTPISLEAHEAFIVDDVDSDGLSDIFSIQSKASQTSLSISLWRNLGKEAGFQREELATIAEQVFRQKLAINVADLNADGHPDLVFLDENGVLSFLKNPAMKNTPWDRQRIFVHGRASAELVIADFDADGDLDVLPNGGLFWYANGGSGDTWKQHDILTTKEEPDEMIFLAEDWNGDAIVDLIVAHGDDDIEIEMIAGPLSDQLPTVVGPLVAPQPTFRWRQIGEASYLNLSWKGQVDVVDIVEVSVDLNEWKVWDRQSRWQSSSTSLTFERGVSQGGYYRVRRVRE